MTVQAGSCFCHFSHLLEVTCSCFLLTQLILFPSQVFGRVEDWIVIVLLVYQMKKRNSLKRCKVYKVERYRKIVLDGNASYDRK